MKEITTTPLFNLQYISLLIMQWNICKTQQEATDTFFQATILSERSS